MVAGWTGMEILMGDVRISIVDSSDPDIIGTTWTTSEDGTHHTVRDLTFDRVTEINGLRATRWHPGFPIDNDWTGADWSNAMCGEAGETANVVKKLRRIECGIKGESDPPEPELKAMLGEEIADVFLYLNLLAQYYSIDMAKAIVDKFNKVSQRQGFPDLLP